MTLTSPQLCEYQVLLLNLLQQYKTINESVKKCLGSHPHNDGVANDTHSIFRDIGDSIKQEIENIDRFELRVAVVAPMKSGKSTIINALIGESILPTRGNAMTTLPTEVVLNRDSKQPTLLLTGEATKLFLKLQDEIRRCLKSEDLAELLDNQSHLVEIVENIIQSKAHPCAPLLPSTVELEKIQATLTFINDLIRIYLIVSRKRGNIFQNVSLKPFLEKNIRLEVPASNLLDENMKYIEMSTGSLTIVDTPGPNEAAGSQELADIVQQELRKAGLVVLVLNFTSMGTTADQNIYEDIVRIREANIDSDCLYVIVNKVDQRRKNDMNKEDVQKFIATKYKISEKSDEPSGKRIFEMKAVHCLTFRKFMKELADLKATEIPFSVKEMKTARQLVKELYPFHESDQDEDIDLDHLCSDAMRMWKNAGLKELMEGPISDLFKKLVPRCLQSALNVCFRCAHQLRKQINDRRNLLNNSKEVLEKECQHIQKDCEEVDKVEEENRKELEAILTEVQRKIDEIIIKTSTKYSKEPSLVSQKYEQKFDSASKKYYAKNTFGVGLIIGGLIAATAVTGGAAAAAVALAGTASGVTRLQNTDDDTKFENEEEAEKFLQAVNEEIYQSCKTVYDNMRNEIELLCNTANLRLAAHIKGTTAGVINKAKERLNKEFSIELIKLETLTAETAKAEINVDRVIVRYRPLWGYTLFGRKTKISSTGDKSKLSDDKLQISRKELIDHCSQSVKYYAENFRKGVDKHFNEVLVKTFESYFTKLTSLFRDYRDEVLDTLQQKSATVENQKLYSATLKRTFEEIEETYKHVKRIADELGFSYNYS